jgi:hypothetical protein
MPQAVGSMLATKLAYMVQNQIEAETYKNAIPYNTAAFKQRMARAKHQNSMLETAAMSKQNHLG